MTKQQLKTVGTGAAVQLIRRRVDIPLGFALLRDRRVPWLRKALALLIGVVGMVAIQALEIPLELLTVIFGSPLGVEDGIEALVWPVVLACGVLPYLLPPVLVDTLRAERATVV